MGAGIVGPAGVTVITPPARESYVKFGKLEVADGSTGFAAFGLPKYAVPIGVYTICTGANATQNISVGYTNGGVELVNAFAPNSTGYDTPGAATGTGVGVQLTADKLVYLKASATLTTPVIVKVEYIIPPQGQPL
jgi:hypothetical protein